MPPAGYRDEPGKEVSKLELEPTPGFEPGTFSLPNGSSVPGEFELILPWPVYFEGDHLTQRHHSRDCAAIGS